MRQKMVTVKQPAETVIRDWHGSFPSDVCTPIYARFIAKRTPGCR